MTIRLKISLFISIIFTILFGVVCLIIFLLSANFRKEEFKERLEEKAATSIRLLTEVKEIDDNLLKTIDRNTINKLYNEKTLIFDSSYKLIYSSLDDMKINWTRSDLVYLKKHKTFFKRDGDNEIYGVFYDTNQQDFYALISANDNYGQRKQQFLLYLLLIAYAVLTTATWFLSFYITKRFFRPLNEFQENISKVNEYNLENRLAAKDGNKNEIDLIAKEFNFLLQRIEDAYQKQKEFTAQASHELRTPLARISAQLENSIADPESVSKASLQTILQNINQLNELINSLLILSKVDSSKVSAEFCRLDDIIFRCIEKVHNEVNEFRAKVSISEDITEEQLTVRGNPFLMENVFYNLLKNACTYSEDKKAVVSLFIDQSKLTTYIINNGEPLTADEQKKIFQPFMRGGNSRNKSGLGLGLRIVQRILSFYGYTISYEGTHDENKFVIIC